MNGTENLVKILKKDMKVITIFLRVPKEEILRRLKERIDKPSEEEIQLRIGRFDFEESKMGNYDYIIDNVKLENTVDKIIEIIKKNK